MVENTEELYVLRKELEDTYKGFIKAVKEKNTELMKSFYAKDCHLIFQDGPKATGRENVVKLLTPVLANLIDFDIKIKDLYKLNEKEIIEIGENIVVEEINGELKHTYGKYVAQWEKQQDGRWQAKLDIGLEY